MQPVFIDGQWEQARAPWGSFQALNPASRELLPDVYPISSIADIDAVLTAAHRAVRSLRSVGPNNRARFLETCASNIEARSGALVDMAHLETALPKQPRLRTIEITRMIRQLRLAASACRDRSWCRATIDTQNNIRSMHGPLGGPVVILGPSNFPFAFNVVGGGDFAAAIAAGNPVIAKANPGHPGTTRLLGEAVADAIASCGLPPGLVQLLYDIAPDDGFRLVSHPLTGATAFTGSRAAGLMLKEKAELAGRPIYLEMSSLNPVFILPGALAERSTVIAQELFGSCSLGAGQFCTKPGLAVLVQDAATDAFVDELLRSFQALPPGFLLGETVLRRLTDTVGLLADAGAELLCGGGEAARTGFRFENTLMRIAGDRFLEDPDAYQMDAFGTLLLVVTARDAAQLEPIAASLQGSLTGSIYSHTRDLDDAVCDRISPLLRAKVGRLLNDRMPTGVIVTPAMNHGGPYPATGHPGFTAVGIPASFLRFAALHCYDGVRAHRLPAELRDRNPTGTMWRLIDGEWSQRDAPPPAAAGPVA